MRVVALVEYEVLGDEEYRYIEKLEDEWDNLQWNLWKVRFVRSLLARGIIVKSIKELEVSYED